MARAFSGDREHLQQAVNADFIPRQSPIKVAYEPGEVVPVELFDGSTILLKKVDAEYDPTSRPAVPAYLEKMRGQGMIVTGLLFIDESLPELHAISGTSKTALKAFDYAALNPGGQALAKLQQRMKLPHSSPILRVSGPLRGPETASMKINVLLAGCMALAMGSCGSDSSEESAAMQQPGFPGWRSAGAVTISPRTYTGGTVTAKVTGFFEVDGSQTLNVPASITDEDQTWLQYGVSGAPELNVLFTNSQSMAEHGVNVGIGPYTVTATSTSGECARAEVEVTPTLVRGRYSCSGSTGYNNQTREMGKVEIEVEFSAGS